MRGIETPVKKNRQRIFSEITKAAIKASDPDFDLSKEVIEIPYRIVRDEKDVYKHSIFRANRYARMSKTTSTHIANFIFVVRTFFAGSRNNLH